MCLTYVFPKYGFIILQSLSSLTGLLALLLYMPFLRDSDHLFLRSLLSNFEERAQLWVLSPPCPQPLCWVLETHR